MSQGALSVGWQVIFMNESVVARGGKLIDRATRGVRIENGHDQLVFALVILFGFGNFYSPCHAPASFMY